MLCKEGPASRILSDLFCSITASDVPLYPFLDDPGAPVI